MQQNDVFLSPRMVTGSLNRTLAITKKTIVVTSKPTRKRTPKQRASQNKRQSTTNDLLIPDSDKHKFVKQNGVSVKNVPLHLSDAERQGPVMPAPVHHYADPEKGNKNKPQRLNNFVLRNQATEIISHIFSQNSSESPPQNILEHFQVSTHNC